MKIDYIAHDVMFVLCKYVVQFVLFLNGINVMPTSYVEEGSP